MIVVAPTRSGQLLGSEFIAHRVANSDARLGRIRCSQKNETIARYSVLKESQQLFAKKHRLHLPSEKELAEELKREVLAIQEREAAK